MNLCNIHFHKNAEHKGGEFTEYAGNGDGHGYQSGYKYSGHLSAAELSPVEEAICPSESDKNPQLRVEAQVYILVNDRNASNFKELTRYDIKNGRYQALNIPNNTGKPVQYAGSTTRPGYNEKGSPYQVTWSVHPEVARVDIQTTGQWCRGNTFNEDHAHGVRNLVKNPNLLSRIE